VARFALAWVKRGDHGVNGIRPELYNGLGVCQRVVELRDLIGGAVFSGASAAF
jgi:hypothetical protein